MNNSVNQEYACIEYFYLKLIKAIACSDNPSDVINYIFDNFSIDDNILSCLLVFTQYFLISNANCLDKKMKDNLYSFTAFLKTVTDDFDRVNELIVLINNCDDSKLNDMVFSEYRKRFGSNKVAYGAISNLSVSTRLLKNMNVRDLNMLITHSKIYDDVTFSTISDIYAVDALEYMASINMIINECPEMLNDELFFTRVCCVRDLMYPKISDKKVMKVYNKFKKNIK